MIQSTAILFFSRSATSEAANKSFTNFSLKANKKIAGGLIGHALSVIKKTSLPYYCIGETRQVGENFGERLHNAIENVFNKGYQSLIVIGNDCPQLTPHKIITAAEALHKKDFVIGPDKRGGIYLIGFNKNSSYKKFCESIHWQTRTVLKNALSYFKIDTVNYLLLPVLSDFNTIKDYAFLKIKVARNSRVIQLLSSVIESLFTLFDRFVINNYSEIIFSSKPLRAPPSLLFL